MGLALEILFGVLILFSFYGAYMASQTWRVYHVLLVMGIFIASLAFLYLAVRALRTEQSWRTLADKRQAELDQLQKQIRELDEGTAVPGEEPKPGITQLRHMLHRIAVDRGGAWFDVKVGGSKQNGTQLTIESPLPHGIAKNMVLYVFDEKPVTKGGRYLGEYKVVTSDPKSIVVTPTDPSAKTLPAKGTVVMYATMPVDRQEPFASMDDDTKAMLPRQTLPEYVSGKRTLRDYGFLFHERYLQRDLLNDEMVKLQSNIDRVSAALAKIQDEIKYRREETANLQYDLEHLQYEQKAITVYVGVLQQKLHSTRDALASGLAKTQQLAARLTFVQLRQADEINARTGVGRGAPPARSPLTAAPR